MWVIEDFSLLSQTMLVRGGEDMQASVAVVPDSSGQVSLQVSINLSSLRKPNYI
jgi:hypothetical protein